MDFGGEGVEEVEGDCLAVVVERARWGEGVCRVRALLALDAGRG